MRVSPVSLRLMIIASLVLHAGLFVLLLVKKNPPARAPEVLMTTTLVKLGEVKPEKFLPRKEVTPPPAIEPEVKPQTETHPQKVEKLVPPERMPTVKERLHALSRVSQVLDRLKKPELAQGDPKGSASGEAKKQQAGDEFVSRVYHCLKDHYNLPGLSAAAVSGRSAEIVIYVQSDGRFMQHRLVKSSGMDAFDRAVIAAVTRCGQVDPPPKEIRNDVRTEGLLIAFTL
jgi:TonB family protein